MVPENKLDISNNVIQRLNGHITVYLIMLLYDVTDLDRNTMFCVSGSKTGTQS